MNQFLRLFCFWLLASCCVNKASSYPLNVSSNQQNQICPLYVKLASTTYLKNLLGYDTTITPESFAVFTHGQTKIETVNSNKISSAVIEECLGRCKGRETAAVTFELQAVYKEKSYKESEFFLVVLPSASVKQLSSCENTSTLVFCPMREQEYCLNFHFERDDLNTKPAISSKLYRRNAVHHDHMTSYQGSHDAKSGHRNVVLGVTISIVGVVLMVLVIALCAGGSKTYDPVQSETSGAVSLKKQSTGEIATSIPSQHSTPTVTVSIQMKNESSTAKTNGSFSSKEHPHVQPPPPSQEASDDLKPNNSENSPTTRDTPEANSKSLSLTARSYDPLPEIPTEGKNKVEDDEVAEAGYDYARFPGRNVDRMEGSDSEGEGDKTEESNKQQKPESPTAATVAGSSTVLPYGKVSRHSNSAKKQDVESEQYAEVRETLGIAPRTRSATEPVDPDTVVVEILRDKRSFTESAAHLPLPAIPQSRRQEEENKKPKPKERLYESVDEMEANDDMYESVPDDLKKQESPKTPNPTINSPTKFPLNPSVTAPLPPSSPIPSRNTDVDTGKTVEKKAVEKTLSTSDGDQKRRFSFFNRKKTASVSSGTRQKKDKDLPRHTSSPTFPASSPPQISPPPVPNIPAPAPPFNEDDEDDVMYDTPQVNLVNGRRTSESAAGVTSNTMIQEAKNKSSSLPRSMRMTGASVGFMSRPNIPLPDLPETSGDGTATVVHKRVFEEPLDGDQAGQYDMVQIIPEPVNDNDEPSYDTVRPEEILEHQLSVNDTDPDPGYDKVGKLKQGEQGQDEEEQQPNEEEGDVASESTGSMKYAKVTRPTSPDDVAKGGVSPEHDEVGYAVVPQEIKMRKRAMSASKAVQQKTMEGSPVAKTKDAEQGKGTTASPAVTTDPTEQYAVIDMSKKRSKKKKPFVEIEILRQVSANAPPVPPTGDLGDLTEFDQPPVPLQSEGVHELVDNKQLSVASGADDPPYAKVMSKTNPYTELDLTSSNDGGPAKLIQQQHTDDTSTDDVGYDTVGDVIGKRSLQEERRNLSDDALGYDTVSDGGTTRKDKSSLESEMPQLKTAATSLEDRSQTGNLYETLESDMSPTHDVGADDVEEDRYEEIDEDKRMQLISKFQNHS